MPQPWLLNVHRRTLKDISERLRPREIYELMTAREWPYKTNWSFYHARDRALLAVLYLTAGRINEVLSLRKTQFDFESEQNFIIIRNMKVSKRKKETIQKYGVPIRDEVPLPLKGQLLPFTNLVLEYLNLLTDEDILFKGRKGPMSTKRAWQIVNHITGKWCHWFRSQAETYLGRNVFKRDPIGLADFVGVVNVQTLREYVKVPWQDYKQQFLK